MPSIFTGSGYAVRVAKASIVQHKDADEKLSLSIEMTGGQDLQIAGLSAADVAIIHEATRPRVALAATGA